MQTNNTAPKWHDFKPDHKAYMKAWHRIHPGYSRKRYIALRLQILKKYSPKLECAKCGFNNLKALCLDHVHGGGRNEKKRLGKYGVEFFRNLKALGYPAGFQVLCANCNMIKARDNHEYGFGFKGPKPRRW